MTKEQIIKSKERVKKRAEVFTPKWVVNAMLDKMPSRGNLYWWWLEPACGNGNFLVEILQRKLDDLEDHGEINEFNVLHALSSIYGVDIAKDNIDEAKDRLAAKVYEYLPDASGSFVLAMIHMLNTNIIVGDMLNHKEDIVFTLYEPGDNGVFQVYKRRLIDMEGGN